MKKIIAILILLFGLGGIAYGFQQKMRLGAFPVLTRSQLGLSTTGSIPITGSIVLGEDSDISFSGSTLTVTNLQVNGETNTNSVFVTPSSDTNQILLRAYTTQTSRPFVYETDDGNSTFFFIAPGGQIGTGATTTSAAQVGIANPAGTSPALLISTSTLKVAGVNSTSTAFIIDSNGKVGIGTTSPIKALSVQGDALFSGSVMAKSFRTQFARTIDLERTIPTTVGNAVDIGSFTLTNGTANLEIWLTVPSTDYSQNKRYFLPVSFNITNNTWQKVLPAATTGAFGVNDADLEIKVNGAVASLRLRRTGGTTAGTAYVTMLFQGNIEDAFAESTTVAAVSAPTVNYYFTAITNTINAVSLASNSVGINVDTPSTILQISPRVTDDNNITYDAQTALITHQTATGATLNDSKNVLVLARQGQAGVAYGAGAAFSISRYENASVNSRTRLDISLAHTTFDLNSNYIMTLLSGGMVGIGTTTPAAFLSVDNDSNTTVPLALFSTTTNKTAFMIDSNGRIGIGTTSPRGSMTISGDTYTDGHQISAQAKVPTVTAGGGTNPFVIGSDDAGKINVGSGAPGSSITVTFAKSYTNAPACIVGDETNILAIKGISTTQTLVVSTAVSFTASDVIDYICRGF